MLQHFLSIPNFYFWRVVCPEWQLWWQIDKIPRPVLSRSCKYLSALLLMLSKGCFLSTHHIAVWVFPAEACLYCLPGLLVPETLHAGDSRVTSFTCSLVALIFPLLFKVTGFRSAEIFWFQPKPFCGSHFMWHFWSLLYAISWFLNRISEILSRIRWPHKIQYTFSVSYLECWVPYLR